MTMLGYSLGGLPFIRRYFDKVILVIIFLPSGSGAIEWLKIAAPHRR
jgi:hypothetical protein